MAIQHDAIIAIARSMVSESDSGEVSVSDVVDAVEDSDDFDDNDADAEKDVMSAIAMSDDFDVYLDGSVDTGEKFIGRS